MYRRCVAGTLKSSCCYSVVDALTKVPGQPLNVRGLKKVKLPTVFRHKEKSKNKQTKKLLKVTK